MNQKLLSVFVVSVLATIALGLSGCKSDSNTSHGNYKQLSGSLSSSNPDNIGIVYDYTDPETGVHYLIYYGYYGRSGMTPRLNIDMSVMVDDESATEAN